MTESDNSSSIPMVPIWLGFSCMIAGVLAIGAPFVAGATATYLVAMLLFLSGVVELFGAFHANSFQKGLLAFLSGGLSLLGGGLMFAHPLMGMGVLTLLLGIYFFMDGLGKSLLAFRVKPQAGWGVVLFGGLVTLLLGILILSKWPLSGVWAIGTLLGVNMLTSGLTMVTLTKGLKMLEKEAQAHRADAATPVN